MRKSLLLLSILCLSWIGHSEAARITCNTYDDYSTRYTTVCDTTTGDIESIRLPTIGAIASDGTIYTVQKELHWPAEEDVDGQCRYVQRISRLDGHPAVPESFVWTTIYEEEYTYDKWLDGDYMVCYLGGSAYNGVGFKDMEVRDSSHAGNHRIYVSNACGACDTKSIYYIDTAEPSAKILYYDLSSAPIGVASCEGLSSYWAGDFYFDNSNNLYISSGNHVPAAIFRITDAGLDAITGVPEQIFENRRSVIMDFVFADDNIFYFHGILDATWIEQGNLTTGEHSVVFTNPSGSSITDLITVLPETGSSSRRPFPGRMTSARSPAHTVPSAKQNIRPPRHTDLLIKDIEIGTPIPSAPSNKMRVRLPVRISIKNSGKDISGLINVAITTKAAGAKREIPAVFSIAGQKKAFNGIKHGLDFQQEVSLAGFVEFAQPVLKTQAKPRITLLAHVNGCQNMPDKKIRKCTTAKEMNTSNNTKTLAIDLAKLLKTK